MVDWLQHLIAASVLATTPVVATYDELYQTVLVRAFDVVRLPGQRLSVVMLSAYAECGDLTRPSCWRMSRPATSRGFAISAKLENAKFAKYSLSLRSYQLPHST